MTHPLTTEEAGRVRTILLEIARREEEAAFAEAAAVPYWAPCPASVTARRTTAAALRVEADCLRGEAA